MVDPKVLTMIKALLADARKQVERMSLHGHKRFSRGGGNTLMLGMLQGRISVLETLEEYIERLG